jgi:uncharacterized protein
VDAPANTYVGDYAGVLSEETEQHIIEQDTKLSQSTGAAIVVAAVDFMDGLSSEEYAYQCFNTWGVGDSDRNNGLLLVYAVGENRVWAMQGSGIEDALTSADLSEMLEDYFYDDYDAGEYDAATLAFFDAAYDWFDSYYGGIGSATGSGSTQTQPSGQYPTQEEPVGGYVEYSRPRSNFAFGVIYLLILLVIIILVADAIRYDRYRRRYLLPGMPPPVVVYHPFIFGRRHRGPRPPMGGGPRPGAGPRPPAGGGARPGAGPRAPRGGGFSGGGFGGGGSRGGGAGRSGGSFGGGSFGGSRGGGFGGGGSRGGGAGR